MADELSERAQRLKADFEKAAALAKERQERETKAKEQPLRRHEPTARPVLAPKGPMAREVDRTAWQEQQSKVDRAVKEQNARREQEAQKIAAEKARVAEKAKEKTKGDRER